MQTRTNSGRSLNKIWDVNASHALYHREGTFYENLESFPGALFDEHGYVVFNRAEDYERSPYLKIGKKLNLRGRLEDMPGYVRMKA